MKCASVPTVLAAVIVGCSGQQEPTALPESTRPQLIVNGVPTDGAYPNVGAFLFDFDRDGIDWYDIVCSGSLIEPTVFLTAAHCLAWLPPAAQLYVTFDSDLQSSGVLSRLILATDFDFDPAFGHDRADLHDLGVVILPPRSTRGITPLQLPTAGYLTEAAKQGTLFVGW
jgi:hypothetical protein